MTGPEIETAITRLVATRYPYEVHAILGEIEDSDDRSTVVAAALARTLAAGKEQGVKHEKARLRARLDL